MKKLLKKDTEFYEIEIKFLYGLRVICLKLRKIITAYETFSREKL